MYYKCVRQYDSTDCGCACLASVSWYYGRKISLSQIVNQSYVGNEGMNLLEIVNVSKKVGLNAVPMKKTENFQEADISLPCIAHVLLANGMFHYVVIFKIGKNKVTIGDPAIGICKVNRESFFFGMDSECTQYRWLGILIFFTPDKDFKTNKIRFNEKLIWKLIVSEKKALLKIVFLTLLSMLCKAVFIFK